jgi:hypothetical protein
MERTAIYEGDKINTKPRHKVLSDKGSTFQ